MLARICNKAVQSYLHHHLSIGIEKLVNLYLNGGFNKPSQYFIMKHLLVHFSAKNTQKKKKDFILIYGITTGNSGLTGLPDKIQFV